MDQEMVAVAQFGDVNIAHLVRSMLESEGIPVWLENERTAGLSPFPFGGGICGVLKVAAEDAQHALELIQKAEENTDTLQ